MNYKQFMKNTDRLKEAMLDLNIPQVKQLLLLTLLCNLQYSSLFTEENEKKWVSTIGKFTDEITDFKFKENLSFVEIEPAHNFLLAMTTAKYLNETEIDFLIDLINKIKSNTYPSSQMVRDFENYYNKLCIESETNYE